MEKIAATAEDSSVVHSVVKDLFTTAKDSLAVELPVKLTVKPDKQGRPVHG